MLLLDTGKTIQHFLDIFSKRFFIVCCVAILCVSVYCVHETPCHRTAQEVVFYQCMLDNIRLASWFLWYWPTFLDN